MAWKPENKQDKLPVLSIRPSFHQVVHHLLHEHNLTFEFLWNLCNMKDMNERFAKDQFARTALRWCFNICEMQNVIKLMMLLLPERGTEFLMSWRILGSLGDGPQLTFPRHKKSGSLPSLHPHYQFQSFFSCVSFLFLHLLFLFSFPGIVDKFKFLFEIVLKLF